MNQPDTITAVEPVVEAFTNLGIRYCIGGSVASSAHGVARTTLDVDVVADLKAEHVRPLADLLGRSFYFDENRILDAIRRRSSFNLIYLPTMTKVDVFVLKKTAYGEESFERRREDALNGEPGAPKVYLASPEDIILNKLVWYRKGQCVSERQWLDVQGVLKVQQASLDFDYLRRWASDLNVIDLLEEALTEAGFGPQGA